MKRSLRTLTLRQQRSLEGVLFVLPWVAGFALFFAWPLVYSLVLSFARVSPAGFRMTFIGLDNYVRAFQGDIEFLPRLWRTLSGVVLDTPIIIVFSLVIAILLNRKLPGRALVRALFFLPVVIASGWVIQELFRQGVGGISVALGVTSEKAATVTLSTGGSVSAGAKTPSIVDITALLTEFLGPRLSAGINAFLNRLGLTLWRSGIQIVLFLAGLQGISRSLYEAGRIDGASEWVLFWRVTLPIISPILLAVIVFTVVDSFLDSFNEVLEYIRATGFGKSLFGYAAALSWIYFLFVFALLLVVLALMRRRVFYRGMR